MVISLFNGQFRFSENLIHEKKFAKVTFAESLQWPIYNYLLCKKKDSCRLQLGTIYVGRIWQIALLTKCAVRLIKCAHLTNLHTYAEFRRGKVWGWIRVRDRVTVWVGFRIRVRG